MSIYFKTLSSIPCYRSLNLLAHAQLEELDIGSQCGGHGLCGGDKIQLDLTFNLNSTHLSVLTDAERRHLSEVEINSGWRLACQCWPSSDNQDIHIMNYPNDRSEKSSPDPFEQLDKRDTD